MIIVSEEDFLQTIREKYHDVSDLLDRKCKTDPENEPYKSRYEAREILCEMKAILSNRLDNLDNNGDREKAMLALVYQSLGTVSMDVEEPSTAEEYLGKSLLAVEGNELDSNYVLCTIVTLNQLGLLWSQRGEDQKAFNYLQRSEDIYHKFNDRHDCIPKEGYEIFLGRPDNEPPRTYEKAHTLTLYYLAQVYRTLQLPLKSALYCHATLKRQLEDKDFDKVEWAVNSATLSQFLLENNAFKSARHHLSAASYILNLRQTELETIVSEEEEHEANLEQLKHRKSDVARCWAKYGLMLLTSSKTRLVASDDEAPIPVINIPDELIDLCFPSLELSEYESKVTCNFLLTFEDARPVFLNAQEWLNQAKEYYTLQEHASDYVSIQQDLSQLYLALTFFEEDESRQCKMHKRRADILTSVVDQISPVHYLRWCRDIWFELGEIYSSMMEIKNAQVSDDRPPNITNKVNYLIQQALYYYTKFLDSFKDPKSGKIPDEFPEQYLRLILLAHVYCGRLYTRIYATDKRSLLDNNKKGLASYKFVVDYCNKNQSAKEKVHIELPICEEMVNLLPYRLAKIMETLS